MEDQIPASTPPSMPAPQAFNEISPEALAAMKARAREMAIQQVLGQPQAAQPLAYAPQPKVVYVRRNLTVAELILLLALASGLVIGVQATWNLASNLLPRLEIRVK